MPQKEVVERMQPVADYLSLQSQLATPCQIKHFATYLADWLGQHVIRGIRIQLYAYTLRLRTSFFNKTPIGRLVTRNIANTET